MNSSGAAFPVVTVQPYAPELEEAVLALRVHPEQLAYVAEVWQMLAVSLAEERFVPYVILAGEAVVGFYRLDFHPAGIADREFTVPSVGLRGYMIDADQQGRGYGTSAVRAMVADIRERYPEVRSLNLTVNCRNTPGIRAYLKAGFLDTGELYHGGGSGPQHVMTMPL